MNTEGVSRVLKRCTSVLFALILGMSSLTTNVIPVSASEIQNTNEEINVENMADNEGAKSKIPAPALPVANEVQWDNTTSRSVRTAQEFLTAYRDTSVARIELLNDIRFTNTEQNTMSGIELNRSLQIDGNNFTLITLNKGASWDEAMFFNLKALGARQTATIHLKRLNVHTQGLHYVDSGYTGGDRWQLILDDVNMPLNNDGTEVSRVTRLNRGHIFVRNNVHLQSHNENFYAGQVTVEPYAKLYGENNKADHATWWFRQEFAATETIDRSVNIGENAHVELVGGPGSGTSWPNIYEHWRDIHVHRGATLKASKLGNAYRFDKTANIPVKHINVFEGATFEGTSTGNGSYPIMREEGGTQNHFYAAPGSIVKLIGQSDNKDRPLVQFTKSGSSFELDQPAVYDLRNNLRIPGAHAVSVGTNAFFKITSSDIEVWDGSTSVKDFDAPPTAGWYRSTVVANSAGKAVAGTRDPYNTNPNLMTTWETKKFSRITGVNDRPELSFDDLTDADKSAYVSASILGVPAWWAEQVTADITNEYGLLVYSGKNGVDGKVKYTLPNDEFFRAGDRYSATGFRGIPEWPALNTTDVTVRDVTPPTPVQVNGGLYHTENYVSGTSDEPGATLRVMLNGRPFAVSGTDTVRADGTWEFTIPDTTRLKPRDVLQIFLTDAAGNTNPIETTRFRDAVFEAGTKIIVTEDPIAFELTFKNPVIYNKGAVVDEAQFFKDIELSATRPMLNPESNFLERDDKGNPIVDFNTVGAYVVKLKANDRSDRVDEQSVVVLIKDDDTIIDQDKDIMLRAADFNLNLSQVPRANFRELAGAQAWRISTGATVLVSHVGAKPTTGGAHDTVFWAGNANKTVKANITDDIDPVLKANTRMVYDKGATRSPEQFLTDIKATLDEAGTITSDFNSIVDLSRVGVYIVHVQGQDLAGNYSNTVRTTVLVKDDDTIIDDARDTLITAYDFNLKLSEVPNADFVERARAQAWRISTSDEVSVEYEGTKPTTGGEHWILFKSGATSKRVKVTISDDVDPTLTADARMIYEKDARRNPDQFLRDVHAVLDKKGKITSDFASVVDLNKVGVYIVTIQGEDATGNYSNMVRTSVLVRDANTVIDDANDTMLSAYNFNLNLSQVRDADFVALARAEAWRISTADKIGVRHVSDKPTTGGTHDTTFNVGETIKTIKANITDDVDPELKADNRIIYDQNTRKTPEEFLQDVHAALDEAGTITSDFRTKVNLNKVGVYIVTLQGEDLARNKSNIVKTTVLVTDASTVIDDTHDTMMTAYDFNLNLSQVPNANFVALARAQAWRISTSEEIRVSHIGDKPTTGGAHDTRFSAGETNKTIKANITDDVDPELTADARIIYNKDTNKSSEEFLQDVHARLNEAGTITSDFRSLVDLNKVGVYIVTLQGEDLAGNKSNVVKTTVFVTDTNTIIDDAHDTMITAYDFDLNLSEVREADFVTLARAQAWRISTSEEVRVQHVGDKPTTGGAHDTTFRARETNKTIKANITDDVDPELTADARIVYDKGTNKNPEQFLEDIKARLNEAGTITSDFGSIVDLNKIGVYIVTLQGEDLAGNKSNVVKTTVFVTDANTIIDDAHDTMITAYDFDSKLSDVPASDFVSLARAQAWRISTSEEVGVTHIGDKPTTGGAHDTTFRAGETNKVIKANITDDVDPELTADARIIYDKDVNKNPEQFLEDVKARLNEAGTITSDFASVVDLNKIGVYIVSVQGEDVAGNKSNIVKTTVFVTDANTIIDDAHDTMITAYDFDLNLSQVQGADFVALARAQAWRISTSEEMNVNHVGEKPTTGGSHDTTFNVGETNKTIKANITDDVDPELTADDRIIYNKDVNKNPEQFLEDIKARLNEAGTITSDFASVVELNKIGVYIVTVQGEDLAGNKSNIVKTTVLVTDANTIIDDAHDTLITAYDFDLNLSQVPGADFVALARAQAWRISTSEALDVQHIGGKPTTGGAHDTTFNVGETNKTIKANITDDVDPELTADARIIYNKDVSKSPEQFLEDIKARLNEAGTITSDFASIVDLNKIGVYIVTVQGEDLAGNKSNIVKTTVFVTDGNTIIDDEHDTMLVAYDFDLNLSQVPGADFVALARAQAWRISTSEAIGVQHVGDKPTTGGGHDTVFNAGETSKTIKANITDDVDPELSADARIIYDKDVNKNPEQFLEDINARLNEAGTITSDFASVVKLDKIGVYIVNVQGEDLAGNKSNVVKTTVFVTDSNTIIDDEHDTMITAYDFDLNLSQVSAADFVALARAQAWRISTSETIGVQHVGDKPTTGGTHDTVFSAGETNKTIKANITDDVDPELAAEARIIYDKDISKTPEQFLEDIKASLNEAGTITSDFNNVVDLNKIGVYIVTVQGEDLAGNKSNVVKTTVLVTDAFTVIDDGHDTMLVAYDFRVFLGDIGNADFVNLAKAQAWRISTSEAIGVNHVGDRPSTGGAHDVSFAAGETNKTVKAVVTDDVDPVLSVDSRIIYDKDANKSPEDFLRDVHAALDEEGTITSDFATVVDLNKIGVYIVTIQGKDLSDNESNIEKVIVLVTDGNTFIDDEHNTMIVAYDFDLNLSQMPDADFVALARAQAWRINTSEEISVAHVGDKPTTGGSHDTRFSAGETNKTIKANLTDDVDPELRADARITYDKDGNKTPEQFLEDIKAQLNEVGTITSDFASVVKLDKIGVYIVTVQGEDLAGNKSNIEKTTVFVSDANVVIDDEHDTMLVAYDFDLNLSEVPNADFVALARAQAWRISTSEEISVAHIGDKPTTGGSHDTVFGADETNKTIKANITDDVDPELSADARIIYDKDTNKTPEQFLEDIKAQLNEAGTITSDFESVVKLDKIGVYIVTVQGEDLAGNKSNIVKTTVFVSDANVVIDDEHDTMLVAYDFALNLSQVPGADFVALARAQAWKISTSETITVQHVGDKPTTGGAHDTMFGVGETNKTIKANITDDVDPELNADARIIYNKDESKTPDEFLNDVHAGINEAGTITSDFASVVDLNKIGVYIVSIQGEDLAGNKSNIVKTTVFVTDANAIIDDEHDTMIVAYEFDVNLSEMANANFVALARAQAWRISTSEELAVQHVGDKPTTGGIHDTQFRAGETSKTVGARVTDDVDPELTADGRIIYDKNVNKNPDQFLADIKASLNEAGTIASDFDTVVDLNKIGVYIVTVQGQDLVGNKSNIAKTTVFVTDGNTVIDDEHDTMLVAYDFDLNLSEVAAAQFVPLARAQAWRISTSDEIEVQHVGDKPTTGGSHDTRFSAGETTKTIKANITDDVDPELTADARIIYDKDVSKNPEQFLEDIKASLNEAGTIGSDFASVVKLDTIGVYIVTVQGEDLAGNKSNIIKTTVFVTDGSVVIDDEHDTMLVAYDFDANLSAVPNADFVALARAQAWRISTSETLVVQHIGEKPTTGGAHDTIFSAGETNKTIKANITDDVDPELTVKNRIMYDKDTNKNPEAFLTDIEATINEAGTITSDFASVVDLSKIGVYIVTVQAEDLAGNKSNIEKTTVFVIDANVVIDDEHDTMLVAYDFDLNLSEVREADFVALARAQAWKISTSDATEVQHVGDKPTTGGTHDTRFTAGETNKTVKANITDDVDPELKADVRIIYDKDVNKTPEEFLADIHAEINEAGTITSDFETVVDLSKIGVYIVKVQGEDLVGNKSNIVQTTVLVTDRDTIIDDEHDTMMKAYEFDLNLSEVPGADFVALARAQAWKISTSEEIQVQHVGDKPTTGGIHDTRFTAGETSKTVDARITDDVDPELNAETRMIYDKGADKTPEAFLEDVRAAINEAGTITSDFASVVDLNKVGVYFVTIQGTDLAGNKSNVVRTTVLVKDEHTVIDDEHDTMMSVHDFDLNLSQVPSADFIALAEGQAWKLSTGEVVDLTHIGDKPTTGGSHDTTFSAGDTRKTVKANITDDVDPELSAETRIIYEKDTNKSPEDFLTDVKAMINEAGTVTSDFASVVHLNQIGVYIVSIQGTDLAGNTSNIVRTTVFVTDANTVIDDEHDTMITAYDFDLNLSEVAGADFVTLARAQAWTISTSEGLPVVHVGDKPTTGGAHDTTFSAGETSKTVKANITDDVDPELSADTRIVYTRGSGKTATEFLTDVHAGINEEGTITSNFAEVVNVNNVGVYIVSIQGTDLAGNKSNIVTTAVLITDEYTDIDTDKQTMIKAKDFVLKLSEFGGASDAELIARGEAQGWHTGTGEQFNPIHVNFQGDKPTTIGSYVLTFQVLNELGTVIVEKPVTMYVYDEVGEEGTYGLNGHQFGIPMALVNTDNFFSYSNIKGYVHTSTDRRELDKDELELLTPLPTSVGQHQATFGVKGTNVTLTVDVEVFETNVTITATDGVMTVAEAQAMSSDQLLLRLNAGVETTNEGATVGVEIAQNEVAKLTALTQGQSEPINIRLDAQDSLGDSTQRTVNVYVYDAANLNEGYAINAQSFTIPWSLVNEDNFRTYANVKSYDVSGVNAGEVPKLLEEPLNVDADFATIREVREGTYPVTFTIPNTATSISVETVVTDDSTPVIMSDPYVVYKVNTKKTMDAFHDDANVKLSKRGAITSDFAQAVDFTKVGAYVVTIQAQDLDGRIAEDRKVVVVITDENTTVDIEHNTMISAHDFTLNLSDVEEAEEVELTEAGDENGAGSTETGDANGIESTEVRDANFVDLPTGGDASDAELAEIGDTNYVELADAKAWDMLTGSGLEVSVERAPLRAGGKHEVVFGAGLSTREVEATVIDNTIVLEAKDVRYSLADFKKFKENGTLERETLKRSKAKGYAKDTKQEVNPLMADMSELLQTTINGGEIFDVTISYEGLFLVTDIAAKADTEERTTYVIKVSIDPPLPTTGEDVTNFVTGIAISLGSLMTLFFVFLYRRRKKQAEERYRLTPEEE